jgi:hypothetical protein
MLPTIELVSSVNESAKQESSLGQSRSSVAFKIACHVPPTAPSRRSVVADTAIRNA